MHDYDSRIPERARDIRFLGMRGTILFPRYLCHACQVCVREWNSNSGDDGGDGVGGRDNNNEDGDEDADGGE